MVHIIDMGTCIWLQLSATTDFPLIEGATILPFASGRNPRQILCWSTPLFLKWLPTLVRTIPYAIVCNIILKPEGTLWSIS